MPWNTMSYDDLFCRKSSDLVVDGWGRRKSAVLLFVYESIGRFLTSCFLLLSFPWFLLSLFGKDRMRSR